MRLVNGIENGVVIDHISYNKGMIVYNKLKLYDLNCTVVLLLNIESKKFGKKDIIKIAGEANIDTTVLGLIDTNISINYIENGKLIKKEKVTVPEKVTNIIKCDNPRCISHSDSYAIPTFTLKSKNGELRYQCNYCDEITTFKV